MDELSASINKLNDRLDDLTDMKIQIATMNSQLGQIVATQNELSLAIRGNGKPGLVERVLRLESDLDQHKNFCPVGPIVEGLVQDKQRREKKEEDDIKEARSRRWQVYFFGITTIVTTTISIVLFLTNLK